MKGHLYKKVMPSGWFVAFTTGDFNFHRTELPLHPDEDELKMVMILNVPVCEFEGKEVEFEIVRYCKKHNSDPSKNSVCTLDCGYDEVSYAKLIQSKEQQKQLITETMEEDAKDRLYEDDVEKLAKESTDNFVNNYDTYKEVRQYAHAKGFIEGYNKAKETLYTKEDVLKAGEIGEINHFDYKHIVSLLDEAKAINQSLKQTK